MSDRFLEHLRSQLDDVRAAGTFKAERVITTPQEAHIGVADGEDRQVLKPLREQLPRTLRPSRDRQSGS